MGSRLLLLILAILGGSAGADAADGAAGKALFAEHCVPCHQEGGSGASGVAPRLAGTLAARLKHPQGRESLASTLVSGMIGAIKVDGETFTGLMPSFAARSDEELAALAAYLVQELNGDGLAPDLADLAPEEFAAARRRLATPGDVFRQRQRLVAATGGK
ncbi:MAG TPA: c-type cytochrome [Azospira sp.]|nr:c-type cytochrome [Azospira sp.]